MKFNKWTMGLAAVGVVSLASAARADEMPMSQVQTALSNTTLSGYVDTAATWRPGTDRIPGTGVGPTGNVPAYSFAKNDGFSLNAIDIALDKPMDESPWASGYHLELMTGPDSVNYYAANMVRQAYVAVRTPIANTGIDWKMGVFDTIVGYESTSDPLNPNYTRSYGYTIEPTTHTGILGTYKVNDMVSVSGGIANSYNATVFPDNAAYESQKTYLGSVALTAPDSWGWIKGGTLYVGAINAVDSNNFGSRDTQENYYVGVTSPTPLDALKVGAAWDYYNLSNGGGEAWVIGLYANYQFNEKLSFNVRAEHTDDDTGLLYAYNSPGVSRNQADEFTATLQYALWANVLSRVEFRWDHVEHGVSFGDSQASGGAPMKANDFLLALNLIYQF
jgi:Putative beta-barrel porin-2, OmpL-like. bbp2